MKQENFKQLFIFESSARPEHFKKIYADNYAAYYNLFSRKCGRKLSRFAMYLNKADLERLTNYFN